VREKLPVSLKVILHPKNPANPLFIIIPEYHFVIFGGMPVSKIYYPQQQVSKICFIIINLIPDL